MKVYLISGLGADRRIFKYLQLAPHCEAVYLDWIQPGTNESLRDYSLRLAERIDTSAPFSIVGLSLGGMVATEIAKKLHPAHLIIISSIPLSAQLPGYYRWMGYCRLHRLLPVNILQKASIMKRFFSTETRDDKRMLRKMIRESDPKFIRWGLEAILQWNNNELPSNIVHIHGSGDGILPKRYTKPTHWVKGAGHMMIMNRSKAINEILGNILVVPDQK